jgi:small GTP-binding protein
MISKKICMLGSFAVGKTSLVSQYVSSLFSDKYLSTVGVKVDRKSMTIDGLDVTLMLWDLYGEDGFQTVQKSYLRGASGYLLVVDGTRFQTLAAARDLQKMACGVLGSVPFVVALNKADLASEWQVDDRALIAIAEQGWPIIRTSAKTGLGVQESFERLTRAMLEPQ